MSSSAVVNQAKCRQPTYKLRSISQYKNPQALGNNWNLQLAKTKCGRVKKLWHLMKKLKVHFWRHDLIHTLCLNSYKIWSVLWRRSDLERDSQRELINNNLHSRLISASVESSRRNLIKTITGRANSVCTPQKRVNSLVWISWKESNHWRMVNAILKVLAIAALCFCGGKSINNAPRAYHRSKRCGGGGKHIFGAFYTATYKFHAYGEMLHQKLKQLTCN